MTKITENSKETVSRLISDEFHRTPDGYWHDSRREELIKTAREFGLDELATELDELATQGMRELFGSICNPEMNRI